MPSPTGHSTANPSRAPTPAEAKGLDPLEVYYDCLLERDGQAIVMMMLLNYSYSYGYGHGEALYEMWNNDSAVSGLADGGGGLARPNFDD